MKSEALAHDISLSQFDGLSAAQLFLFLQFLYDPALRRSFEPSASTSHGHLFEPTRTEIAELLSDRNNFWSHVAFHVNSNSAEPALSPEKLRVFGGRVMASAATMSTHELVSALYSLRAQVFPDAWYTFMNYGYFDAHYLRNPLELTENEDRWRECVQMYDHLARHVVLEGKDVLEVGCGRGGGASYLKRAFRPRSYVALDACRSNVMFCARAHAQSEVKFCHGRAEQLPFEDATFDVLLNVESFNYYAPLEKFAAEARRVLKSGGGLVVTSFDPPSKMLFFQDVLSSAGFRLVAQVDTTLAVQSALRQMLERFPRLLSTVSTSVPLSLYAAHLHEAWGGYPAPLLLTGESRYYEFKFVAS